MRSIYYCFIAILCLGCFCESVVSSGNVRRVNDAKGYSICNNHPGKGLANEVTPYFGFIMVDSTQVLQRFQSMQNISGQIQGFRQYGISLNRSFVSPLYGMPVIQLGIDYSFDDFRVNAMDANHEFTGLSFENQRHRIALNFNHYYLFRSRLIGYFSFQYGAERLMTQPRNESSTPFELVEWDRNWISNYRVGTGLRLFFNGPFGVSIEGGYGGGAYLRTGLFVWF